MEFSLLVSLLTYLVNQMWTSARRLFTAVWQMLSNVETPRVLTSAT